MNEKPKVLIVGAGTMGFAIAMVLCRLGVKVTICDTNKVMMEEWIDKGFCDFHHWMKPYGLPENLTLHNGKIQDCKGYHFIFLAVPFEQLVNVVGRLYTPDPGAVLVTVQKGLNAQGKSPQQIVQRYFHNDVISMTGAAFGDDLAAGCRALMIIASPPLKWSTANLLKELFDSSNITFAIDNSDWGAHRVARCNAMRTASSLVLGIIEGYWRGKFKEFPVCTMEAIRAKVAMEYWFLLTRDGVERDQLTEATPRVLQTIEADLHMCEGHGRNYEIGSDVGFGSLSTSEARKGQTKNGVAEGVRNLLNLSMPDGIEKDIPFHYYGYKVLKGEMALDDAFEAMMARQ